MKQIMQRYTDKKEEPSISDLRGEVKLLKEEVLKLNQDFTK